MNMNFVEVLPVSKPPPEASARAGLSAAETRRTDVPSFEETLRARQREDQLTQSQAEAAASQSVTAVQAQPASPPSGETPPGEGSANPGSTEGGARISGALLGMLSGQMPLPGASVEGVKLPVEQVAVEEAPFQPLVEFAPLLDEALEVAAPKLQADAKGVAETKPLVPEAPANPVMEAAAAKNAIPKGKVEASPESHAENLPQGAILTDDAPVQQLNGVPAEPVISHNPAAFIVRDEALPQNTRLMADMVRQIASQMEASIQHGRSSLRLQLNPQELGGIDIRFASSSQGISVTVYAEQASTGRLLETQLNQLRQSLNEAGVNLTQLNIHHHSPSQQQHGGYAGHNPHGRSGLNRSMTGDSALSLETVESWRNTSANGVDYRI